MKCWKCGETLEDPPGGKLAFRAVCDKCTSWLYCCKNCKNYYPGLPNDCKVPGTEYIADRETCNFCEEFNLLGAGPVQTADPSDASRRLFGNSKPKTKDSSENNFNNLFND